MQKLYTQITFLIFVLTCSAKNYPEVEINNGVLRGAFRKSWNGRTFSAFTGIPYAKPPIGELRFKESVPAESWSGVLDASKPHAVCPQIDALLNNYTVIGSEDCLFLNVYTPQLPNTNENTLPVMLYIHGGAFYSGSANADMYGPDILLDKDIVFVTINYRLDALGFLSTEDEVLPGNNGLKDQNLAIKWVKSNIAHFGGNPNKITIFGQSAGGASVHYHMLSPLSKDLMSGVIAQSGAALSMWAFAPKGQASRNAKRLAEFLNCPSTSSQEIVECLKNIDAHEIVEQSTKFMVYSYDPMVTFKPVIEPNSAGAFLAEDPIDIIKSGKAANVPFILGMTTEDGAIRSAGIYNDSELLEELNRDFNRVIPIILQYEESPVNKDNISRMLREFYFGKRDIDRSTKSELTDLFTDGFIFSSLNVVAELHAKYSKQPVYHYMFGYRGSLSYTPLFGDNTFDYGVCHCDDLLYLLSNDFFSLSDYKKSSDLKFIDIMTTLWTNFAETGNPTPKTDSLIPTKWQPLSENKLSYYFLKDVSDIKMVDDVYNERVQFWKKLPIVKRESSIRDEL